MSYVNPMCYNMYLGPMKIGVLIALEKEIESGTLVQKMDENVSLVSQPFSQHRSSLWMHPGAKWGRRGSHSYMEDSPDAKLYLT